jgi:hypothetical protein
LLAVLEKLSISIHDAPRLLLNNPQNYPHFRKYLKSNPPLLPIGDRWSPSIEKIDAFLALSFDDKIIQKTTKLGNDSGNNRVAHDRNSDERSNIVTTFLAFLEKKGITDPVMQVFICNHLSSSQSVFYQSGKKYIMPDNELAQKRTEATIREPAIYSLDLIKNSSTVTDSILRITKYPQNILENALNRAVAAWHEQQQK